MRRKRRAAEGEAWIATGAHVQRGAIQSGEGSRPSCGRPPRWRWQIRIRHPLCDHHPALLEPQRPARSRSSRRRRPTARQHRLGTLRFQPRLHQALPTPSAGSHRLRFERNQHHPTNSYKTDLVVNPPVRPRVEVEPGQQSCAPDEDGRVSGCEAAGEFESGRVGGGFEEVYQQRWDAHCGRSRKVRRRIRAGGIAVFLKLSWHNCIDLAFPRLVHRVSRTSR